MDKSWHKRTIATIRWKIVGIAGKVVQHGRQVILKLVAPLEKVHIFFRLGRGVLGSDNTKKGTK